MLPIYISFFNLILETGIIPESWLEGVIKPVYKCTGDPKQPENIDLSPFYHVSVKYLQQFCITS